MSDPQSDKIAASLDAFIAPEVKVFAANCFSFAWSNAARPQNFVGRLDRIYFGTAK